MSLLAVVTPRMSEQTGPSPEKVGSLSHSFHLRQQALPPKDVNHKDERGSGQYWRVSHAGVALVPEVQHLSQHFKGVLNKAGIKSSVSKKRRGETHEGGERGWS